VFQSGIGFEICLRAVSEPALVAVRTRDPVSFRLSFRRAGRWSDGELSFSPQGLNRRFDPDCPHQEGMCAKVAANPLLNLTAYK
jgi:hypothetical protein